MKNDDEDDDISLAADSAMETIDFFTPESHLSYSQSESINLPDSDIKILDQFKRRVQMHRIRTHSAKATGSPTLLRFFAPSKGS
jgi:hypothetical protein